MTDEQKNAVGQLLSAGITISDLVATASTINTQMAVAADEASLPDISPGIALDWAGWNTGVVPWLLDGKPGATDLHELTRNVKQQLQSATPDTAAIVVSVLVLFKAALRAFPDV